jgi:hypothetical protein
MLFTLLTVIFFLAIPQDGVLSWFTLLLVPVICVFHGIFVAAIVIFGNRIWSLVTNGSQRHP